MTTVVRAAEERRSFDPWIRRLLVTAPLADPTLLGFVDALRAAMLSSDTIEAAAEGGAMADRLGFAFTAGYHSALSQLLRRPWSARAEEPRVETRRRACFAATEASGAHPRAIQTELTAGPEGQLVLSGKKTFVTLAPVAEVILVVAKQPDAVTALASASTESRHGGERPRLVVVCVPASRAGITSIERAPLPFAVEIPHAEVTFDAVRIEPDEVLPGDGYAIYMKPFRTVEDLHVLSAAAGHLLGVARRHHLGTLVAPVVSVLVEVWTLGHEDPTNATTHLALAALFERARRVFDDVIAALPDRASGVRSRLERDRPLLHVADGVRAKRLETALSALGLAPGG